MGITVRLGRTDRAARNLAALNLNCIACGVCHDFDAVQPAGLLTQARRSAASTGCCRLQCAFSRTAIAPPGSLRQRRQGSLQPRSGGRRRPSSSSPPARFLSAARSDQGTQQGLDEQEVEPRSIVGSRSWGEAALGYADAPPATLRTPELHTGHMPAWCRSGNDTPRVMTKRPVMERPEATSMLHAHYGAPEHGPLGLPRISDVALTSRPAKCERPPPVALPEWETLTAVRDTLSQSSELGCPLMDYEPGPSGQVPFIMQLSRVSRECVGDGRD